MFITEATAQSNNGRLALAPNVPGQIVALELGEKQYRLNDGAFLAMDGSASYTLETQSVGRALFGGQGGFYVMSTQGQGGHFFGKIPLADSKKGRVCILNRITIDNAHVVAWSRELEYDIHLENGLWQSMGTGEGVVNTFHGTGEIYIQSLNIETFANVLRPHLHIDNS